MLPPQRSKKGREHSPVFLEKGRHPLVPLDRLQIVQDNSTDAPVDIREFVAKLWVTEERVNEKMRMTSSRNADKLRRDVEVREGVIVDLARCY